MEDIFGRIWSEEQEAGEKHTLRGFMIGSPHHILPEFSNIEGGMGEACGEEKCTQGFQWDT